SAFGGTGFILTWTESDLIYGFAIGFLITMATIGIASWRVSKLNIVRAIRDIPEPVPHGSTRRQVAAGAAIAVLGALGFIVARLLVVLFNSDSILAVATRLVRRRTWRPVVRTAIAYPMNKKFRTGATLASIALVMFTIATMSGIQAEVSSSIATTSVRESGGFALIGASGVPIANVSAAFDAYRTDTGSTNITDPILSLSQARLQVSPNATFAGRLFNTSLIGVPAGSSPPFELQSLDPKTYPDP